jgi:3-methylcrotonyl-CoA carboxylase alpha subunit
MPSVGKIEGFRFSPKGQSRLETGVAAGAEVSPFYDSMIAKLITHGQDRDAAIQRQINAFRNLRITGPQTNMAFLHALLVHADVMTGKLDTGLIARNIDVLTFAETDAAIAEGALALIRSKLRIERQDELNDPWARGDAFQLGASRHQVLQIVADGLPIMISVDWRAGQPAVNVRKARLALPELPGYVPLARGDSVHIIHNHRQTIVSRPVYDIYAHGNGDSTDAIVAPINGRLARIFVEAGQQVAKGDKIAVVEAMKMEHMLVALRDGTIDKIAATEGAQVTQGTLIVTLVEVV